MPHRTALRLRTITRSAFAAAIVAALIGCNALTGAGDFVFVAPEPDAGSGALPSLPTDAGNVQPARDGSTNNHPTSDAGPKRVFVTSGAWPGAGLGGVEGADEKCRQAAIQAGLGDVEWRAWLSTTQQGAAARITHVGDYNLIDGGVAVNTPDGFAAGTLQQAINITEYGAPAAASADLSSAVWTGTVAGGAAVSTDPAKLCSDWTGASVSAVGSCFRTDAEWTYSIPGSCLSSARLYCFEL